jgi:glycosyltransferase involved in cell wall biosynthesis
MVRPVDRGTNHSSSQSDQATRKPSVLIIAYDFPPIASAGMYRVTSMARHLIRLGWNVTVLTVKESFVYQTDSTRSLVPEGVRIERTRTFEYKRVKRWIGRHLAGREMPEDPEGSVGVANGTRAANGRRRGTLKTLSTPVRWAENLLSFPDSKAGWFLPLLLRSRSLIATRAFDVVVTSSPPHSTHLPLLVLRRFMQFKWVVDFRDPWTAPKRAQAGGLRYHIRRSLEKDVLTHCDCIIANTPGNEQAILRAFPRISENKIEVITNGFDDARIGDLTASGKSLAGYDIAYFGAVYAGMLDPYAMAIKNLRERGHDRIPRLAIFGKLPVRVRSDLIRAYGLEEFIEFKGRLTRDESDRLMREAKSLLLLLPAGQGNETWVPSKLYTYLSTQTPIFGILPRGDAWKIVESAGGGVLTEGNLPDVVADRLVDFLRSVEKGSFRGGRNPEIVRAYTWDTLSTRLNARLMQVISAGL